LMERYLNRQPGVSVLVLRLSVQISRPPDFRIFQISWALSPEPSRTQCNPIQAPFFNCLSECRNYVLIQNLTRLLTDHSTISDFRKRLVSEVTSRFTQVPEIANDLRCLNVVPIFMDDTKIKVNALKHHANSFLRAKREPL
jgi:hypothetical protein